ncbi:MAG: copper amine oxidase N-terminal domain-containing protein, partial [Defluviitaleaceae bacterium]|nr:copper amine oxidase N-terminal domain-containing protein [Defluviitaleaceae bacterium]
PTTEEPTTEEATTEEPTTEELTTGEPTTEEPTTEAPTPTPPPIPLPPPATPPVIPPTATPPGSAYTIPPTPAPLLPIMMRPTPPGTDPLPPTLYDIPDPDRMAPLRPGIPAPPWPVAQIDPNAVSLLVVPVGSHTIYLRGEPTVMDTAAFVSDIGAVMIPLRFVGYALGQEVTWRSDTATAAILDTRRRRLVQFVPGQNTMYVNGVAKPILTALGQQIAVEIRDGRIFIPMRAVGQAFELPFRWDEETQTANFYVVD